MIFIPLFSKFGASASGKLSVGGFLCYNSESYECFASLTAGRRPELWLYRGWRGYL